MNSDSSWRTRILGTPIVYSIEATRPEKVQRSIWERLFSWPWHPFRRYGTVKVPAIYLVSGTSPMLTRIGLPRQRMILAHPTFASALETMRGRERKRHGPVEVVATEDSHNA